MRGNWAIALFILGLLAGAVYEGFHLPAPSPWTAVAAAGFDEDEYARFNETNLKFFREYYACPEKATSFDQCKPALGMFNAKQWSHVVRDARVFR